MHGLERVVGCYAVKVALGSHDVQAASGLMAIETLNADKADPASTPFPTFKKTSSKQGR